MTSPATIPDLKAELARVTAERDRVWPVDSGDPALARLGGAALRQHHKATDSALRRYTEAATLVQVLRGRLSAAEYREADANRTRLTADDVRGATAIRDQDGWHEVVRVSAKSVTVATPYSWTERVAIDQVLEVSR